MIKKNVNMEFMNLLKILVVLLLIAFLVPFLVPSGYATTPTKETMPDSSFKVITYNLTEELPHYKIMIEGTVKNVGNEAVNRSWIIATFILTQGRSSKEMRVFFTDNPFLPGETQNFRFRTDMTQDAIKNVELSTGGD